MAIGRRRDLGLAKPSLSAQQLLLRGLALFVGVGVFMLFILGIIIFYFNHGFNF